jgi:hypothetical protein
MNNKGKEKSKAKFRGLTLMKVERWRAAAACPGGLWLAAVSRDRAVASWNTAAGSWLSRDKRIAARRPDR